MSIYTCVELCFLKSILCFLGEFNWWSLFSCETQNKAVMAILNWLIACLHSIFKITPEKKNSKHIISWITLKYDVILLTSFLYIFWHASTNVHFLRWGLWAWYLLNIGCITFIFDVNGSLSILTIWSFSTASFLFVTALSIDSICTLVK